MNSSYWNNDRIMRLIIGVALTVALLWLIYYLREALLPFFVAILVAYMLQPLVRINQKMLHTQRRALASILSIIEVTIVIGVILWVSLPSVISELDELTKIIDNIADGKIRLPREYAPVVHFFSRNLNPAHLSQILSQIHIEELFNRSISLLEQSWDIVIESLAWLLTLIYILFILIDYDEIIRGLKMIIPLKYRPQVMEIVDDIKSGMNHYFRGQGVVALFAMAFYCIGFSIVGLPLAIPMGILVGILYMIPYFQYVTVIPVAAISFIYSLGGAIQFWPELGKCALVYVVSQCICDYIITPRVMGKELGLNPAVIFLSLTVWGTLLGIIGMIIALPVTALIMSYYKKYISNRS